MEKCHNNICGLCVCVCFSSSCLRSWLEQDTSCPTCRTSLNINGDGGQARNQQQGGGLEDNIGPVGAAADARPHINQHNHFFHFDGESVGHKSEEESGCGVTVRQMTVNYIMILSLTGSRIASWLPSFSVEVMHTTNILGIAQANNSQLMAMVSPCLQSDEILVGFLILHLHKTNAAIIWSHSSLLFVNNQCLLPQPVAWVVSHGPRALNIITLLT